MRKLAAFACSVALFLLVTGCSNPDETPISESVSDPIAAEEQPPSEPAAEPVTLNVSDLKTLFAGFDLSEATLTYHGESEATYPADIAIRAEDYLKKLENFVWEEAAPPAGQDGNDDYFCQLSAPGVTITALQSNRLLRLITDDGEGWFVLPYIENEQDNSCVQVSWMIYNTFSSWFTEAQTASLYGGTGIPLTAEELGDFEAYTASTWTEYDAAWRGYMSGATEISCFFTSLYSDPRDMDASEFLWYCPDQGTLETGDEAEWQLVQTRKDWRFGDDNHLATIDELPVPVHRIPRAYINEILTKYAGITVEEMHTDWMAEALYIPETDCFYTFTSDFGPGTFIPCYGEKQGDIVTLWEAPNGYDGFSDMLILQKSGENWLILSHQTTSP